MFLAGGGTESWKARLETACLTRFGTQVLWSGLALQTVAQICLVTDLLDIQVRFCPGFRLRVAY